MTRGVFVLVLVCVFVAGALGVGALVIWEQFRERDAMLTATRIDLRTTESELARARSTLTTFEEANQRLSGDLQETNDQRNEALAKGRTLQADLLVQHRENSQIQSINADLSFQLDDSEARNTTLSGVNDGLKVDGERLAGELADAHEVYELLTVDYQELQTVNNALAVDYQDLQSTNDQQAQGLADSQEENRLLEGWNRQLASELSDTESSLALLKSRVQSLQSVEQRRDDVQAEISRLESQISELEDRIVLLKADILLLKAARAPLSLNSWIVDFSCTGSMEPKITCLDTATMLRNFRPEDIRVGTVISFKPTTSCGIKSEGVLHRVVNIKIQNGIYYFWPKGDNSPKADGCWIPESNVAGYIIKLHKNTLPQNSQLRDRVNDAEAKMERAHHAYRSKYEQYCGILSFAYDLGCTLPRAQVEEIKSLKQAYLNAFDHFKCWLDAARNSKYPGSYVPCPLPAP